MSPQSSPPKLTDDRLRIPLERFISDHLGRPWTITESADLADFACHPAAILSDASYSVFAKFSDAANGLEQFEIELAGPRRLANLSGILIPTPVGILPITGGSMLVLETVQAVERTPLRWHQIGQALARIHAIKGDRFGLETHGDFGQLYQDNTPTDNWVAFYAERRLRPGLQMALASGNLPPDLVPKIENIISRLPELCGPDVAPTLLHGDAQQNNFISNEKGAVAIDPAVYYGHPEMDLAYVDYFQPVPPDVFEGYQELLSIDPGFWERRDLWRLWGYLAAVSVEGAGYLERLTEAIKRYL